MVKIKLDKNNYRKHNEANKKVVKKSLEELGAGRSLLLDSNDCIIAGNATYEQSQELNIPIKIIETDGSELIAVKRTDLKTSDKKRKELALADNQSTDLSEFDYELIHQDFEMDELKEWEFEETDFDIDIERAETDFPELASGDKEPFQQMTFTLADKQAEITKQAIDIFKKSDTFNHQETFGNENSNGNALYGIIQEWYQQKT